MGSSSAPGAGKNGGREMAVSGKPGVMSRSERGEQLEERHLYLHLGST